MKSPRDRAALGEALREVMAGDVRSQRCTVAAADLWGTRVSAQHIPIAPALHRLGPLMQDSVVTYQVRVGLHAANASMKTHFRDVKNLRCQDALLVCLKVPG